MGENMGTKVFGCESCAFYEDGSCFILALAFQLFQMER